MMLTDFSTQGVHRISGHTKAGISLFCPLQDLLKTAHAALIWCFAFEMHLVIQKKPPHFFFCCFFIGQLEVGSTKHALICLLPVCPELGLSLCLGFPASRLSAGRAGLRDRRGPKSCGQGARTPTHKPISKRSLGTD